MLREGHARLLELILAPNDQLADLIMSWIAGSARPITQQEGEGRGQRHGNVVGRETQAKDQSHSPAVETIGHSAEQGRVEELHQSSDGDEKAEGLHGPAVPLP